MAYFFEKMVLLPSYDNSYLVFKVQSPQYVLLFFYHVLVEDVHLAFSVTANYVIHLVLPMLGSSLTTSFSNAVLRLVESGQMQEMKSRWWVPSDSESCTDKTLVSCEGLAPLEIVHLGEFETEVVTKQRIFSSKFESPRN